MKRRALIWLLPTLLYAAFVLWYTDLGGPLSDAEVDAFVEHMRARDSEPDPEALAGFERFFRADTGRQFLMVNALDMAEDPPAVEGAPPNADASALMDLYMEHMYAQLLRRACHPVVFGEASSPALDIVGIEGAREWTHGALFRYRSRRALMEIAMVPGTRERHAFKLAALDKTIAYPIETKLYLGDLRLLLGLLLLTLTALADAAYSRRTRRG